MEPILASTWSFGAAANDAAWPVLDREGALAAVEAACRHADLDPTIDSVGYGGLPDAEGRMALDGAVMLDPRRFGGVCGLRRHQHPASVGRLVMERTEHGLLCGEDADRFADAQGMPQADLLSPEARDTWEAWKSNPTQRDDSRDGAARIRPMDDGRGGGSLFGHDTIGTLALDGQGILAGGCSTSGLAYKVPGRVGDSPIVGHGLYVLPGVGSATATGAGELISGICASFLAVETLRRGGSILDAVAEVLERADGLDGLEPHHQVGVVVLDSNGGVASGALRGGFRAAIRTAGESRIVEPDQVARPDEADLPENARDAMAPGEDP
ncbi:MAG: isoaspartyl peptidase/L-asparaginase [Phycisphaerales bacterium]|nr:isoaspartyl peptidase/L-asparaginase [Phycisphaerales bacterium]